MPDYFLNIHTHRKPQSEDEVVIRNAYLSETLQNHRPAYPVSAGIHPWFIENDWKNQIEKLRKILLEYPVAAIGECGIDRVIDIHLSTQYEVMEAQIALNQHFNKPWIIHCVKACSDFLFLLKQIPQPVIFHDYRCNLTQTKSLMKYNRVYFSFGKSMLNPTPKLKEVIDYLPVENIFLETDTSPVKIQEIYRQYADLKKISVSKLKSGIVRNQHNAGINLL